MQDSGTLFFVLSTISLVAFLAWAGYRILWVGGPGDSVWQHSVQLVMRIGSALAIAITLAIIVSLLFEAQRFFAQESLTDFLFGLQWNAQTSQSFGAVPLFLGTFLVTIIAMTVAAPIGVFSAIYLAEYATPGMRRLIKPILEVLSGIPTVIFGLFALFFVAPIIQRIGQAIDQVLIAIVPGVTAPLISPEPTSAMAAGIVIGIMVIPFIASLSDDILRSVPGSVRDGALALGATRSEMMWRVLLPAAMPGIAGAFLLAVSRAIGDTMVVSLVELNRASLSANPFDNLTTVTAQIVELLTGDIAFSDSRTLVAFALGLTLFVVTFILNGIALFTVRRFREYHA